MVCTTQTGSGKLATCAVVLAVVALSGCGDGGGSVQQGGLTVRGTASMPGRGGAQLSQVDRGIDLIAAHRRKKLAQDGPKLRRYRRRWIVERISG